MQRHIIRSVIWVLGVLASAAPGLAADLSPAQQAAICGGRSTCRTVATDAGRGASGENLIVVEARFGLADKAADAPEEGCINDSGAADAPDHDGGHEFWLIAGAAAPRRVLALCNDGYGAAGIGEDAVKIGPNVLTHEETGGSAWRWDVTRQISLSPLRVVHELICSFNVIGPGSGQVTEIDRRTLQARAVGYVAGQGSSDQDTGDCPDWPTGPDSTLPAGPKLAGGYAVPMSNAGPGPDGLGLAYPDGTALGDCALEMTTDGRHGFLVFGTPADPASAASLRVIKETEGSLLIQVYDPTAAAELKAGKARTWVGQPHIEIWTGEPGIPAEDSDAGPVTVLHQFAIGLDGATYPGANAFHPLPNVAHWAAKDEAGRDVTVYRVEWPGDDNRPSFGLGVAYSQAENGRQARLVSNAQIKKNRPLYLPEAWDVAPADDDVPAGACAVGADKILRVTP